MESGAPKKSGRGMHASLGPNFRRKHEASSDAIAKDWDRVALMIARKTEGLAESVADSALAVDDEGAG